MSMEWAYAAQTQVLTSFFSMHREASVHIGSSSGMLIGEGEQWHGVVKSKLLATIAVTCIARLAELALMTLRQGMAPHSA